MANTAGVCDSFKAETLTALHALGTTVTRGATTADTVKGALYFATATIDHTTTAYTATGEIGASGTYVAGGLTLTNGTAPALNGTQGVWTPSASYVVTGLTATAFDTILLYNSTQGNRAIEVCTFGSQSITAGTLTLTMPANTSGNALLRLA